MGPCRAPWFPPTELLVSRAGALAASSRRTVRARDSLSGGAYTLAKKRETSVQTPPAGERRRSMAMEYLRQSRRPLVSLAFVLPLLALYEGGVLWLGPAAMRNGADVWLRRLLDQLGFGQYFLLPVLTVSLLLAWHHITHDRWRLPREVVLGMYVETSLLAVVLLGIGYLQRSLAHLAIESLEPAALYASMGGSWDWAARLVGFCGAGIYEEVLFRLILVPVVVGIAAVIGLARPTRVALAVVVTSAVFSAAHYAGAHGETFEWFSFSFRFLAGAFFAVLFVYRGFGVAAGTHALYDIFVGVV